MARLADRMKANDLPEFYVRVRCMQGLYPEAHEALKNWGRWSRDRRGMFPTLAPPSLWNQFKRSEVEDYGEVAEGVEVALDTPVKADPPDEDPYDEKSAVLLDERLHAAGGLPDYIRLALRAAYVSIAIPEDQFPTHAECSRDAFLERLEYSLQFVRRFV